VTWSALRAEAAKYQFTFAKHAFPQRARSRLGYFVPVDILNIAAVVANEVVMPRAFGVEACGTAFDGDFSHQTCLNQVPQIVIRGGPGGARIHPIHGFKDLCSRGMATAFHQEFHYGVALGRTPQPAALQGLFNRLCLHGALE
jgi:hypothetical protein